jgi:D-glycerate 3-kinase
MANDIAPLVRRWIETHIAAAPPGHVPLLFLSGAQGSGKSTAVAEAIRMLTVPALGISIDEFYLTRAERRAMARQHGYLFDVRGPPGTHDLALLDSAITALRAAGPHTETRLPVFDKLADDRLPPERWRAFCGRPAAIIVEGWLMGAAPDPSAPGSSPVNAVEEGDFRTDWRRAQETALAGPYARLWDQADGFLHILAPDFDTVFCWRRDQEEALWAARGEPMPSDRRGWVHVFIQHYERLTRRMLAGGRRPGAEIYIDARRRVIRTEGL